MRQLRVMQRARRTLSLVLAVLVGTVVLSGCRSEPTVAAYVDGKQYTVRSVNQWVQEINDVLDTLPADQRGTLNFGKVRQLVLRSMIFEDVVLRAATDHGVAAPQPDLSAAEVAFGLPEGSPLTEPLLKTHLAESIAKVDPVFAALGEAAPSVEPSEADRHEVYNNLTSQGQPINLSYDSVGPHLTTEQIGTQLGLRDWLRDAVERHHVVVNPKYAPLSLTVPIAFSSSTTSAVTVDLVAR